MARLTRILKGSRISISPGFPQRDMEPTSDWAAQRQTSSSGISSNGKVNTGEIMASVSYMVSRRSLRWFPSHTKPLRAS